MEMEGLYNSYLQTGSLYCDKLVHTWFELIGVFKVNVVLKLIVLLWLSQILHRIHTITLFKLSKAKSIGLIKEWIILSTILILILSLSPNQSKQWKEI